MMLNQEPSLIKLEEARNAFSELTQGILESAAQGERINDVELKTWHSLMNLGRLLLEGFVEAQGSGDLGPSLEYQDRRLERLENLHCRRYVSIYGELSIPRTIYGTRESQKHEIVPLDARLELPESDFSYVLQDWSQTFCVENTFGKTDELLQKVLSIGLSTRTLQRMGKAMSQDVEQYRDSLPMPPSEDEGEILVVTADCKGVPMRREPEEKQSDSKVRRGKGEKANKKKMACVGAVYSIGPFIRTADDVIDELQRKERRKDRPTPRNKHVRAELTRVSDGDEIYGKEAIFSWFKEQRLLRNESVFETVVCLMDGERALWNMLKIQEIDAIRILDIFHVLERMWDAAHCFHAEKSEEAEMYVTTRLKSLLEGKVGRVIGGLKQMATKHKLNSAKQKQLEKVIKYLENNRNYMAYDEYLAQGYPIGSGVVEGACRHLVKDRMERTGMRWNVGGAQAILDLRSTYINEQWDEFQQFRIETNGCKLYPFKELVQNKWREAA